MRRLSILFVLLAAGCGSDEPSAQEKEARELRDIAMVNAAQKVDPPRKPVRPEEILPPDMEENDLLGVSCSFTPTGQSNPVALGTVGTAFIKLDARIERLAADKGGEKMPYGTWAKYDGKKYVLKFAKGDGDGERSASDSTRWPGHMSLFDSYDRIIYEANGAFQCGN
jgi:hypothetical protein